MDIKYYTKNSKEAFFVHTKLPVEKLATDKYSSKSKQTRVII